MKIAPHQRQELDFLRKSLETLEKISDRTTRPSFRALRDRLDQWAARVAVIGQVKAGKSTFVNALLHQHDFLPSDVNPWTSVVTNIRINLPGDPATGARFDFFGEADWDEIVNSGSRIRELTEQLLPGFDTELLRVQSEQMRDRAQRRLGKHYHALLGNRHEYDFLSADLLKRYVCAGPNQDEGLVRASLGRYAALTKTADVYMRLPAFHVPTIITDTPGVNDPFLVRDELTCRSLDKSDVFVMVLSAHQPLTDVDIALIRILAEQDEKDVVIFVNRIDELDDYARNVPRVLCDVSTRLRRAIPDIDFRIVAGSAYLADLVLRTDPEAEAARAEADTEELAAYVASLTGSVPADRDARLELASGMDRLRATMSDVIDEGTGGRYLARLLADVRAEINGVLFAAKRQRESLKAQVESITSEVARDGISELNTEIDAISRVHQELQRHIEGSESQIEKAVNKSWAKLETRLLSQIETFVEDQKSVFHDRMFSDALRGGSDRTLEIQMGPLQAQMETEVRQGFDRSRAAIDIVLHNCLTACRHILSDTLDDSVEAITLDELPYDSFTSTLTLSRRTLNVDLITERGLAFWRRPTINAEKTLAAMRMIATAELRPAVEKILSAFNEAQVERASAGGERLRVLLRMVQMGLNERTQRLKKDRRELERVANDPALQRQIVDRLQSQLEVLERRLLNFASVEGALVRAQAARPGAKPAARAA